MSVEMPVTARPIAVQSAIQAATLSLLAFAACLALFATPLGRDIQPYPQLKALLGFVACCSYFLHLAFVTITARRMQRSPYMWLALAALLFPFASIAGLVWLRRKEQACY